MSAFIVSKAHVAAIVRWYARNERQGSPCFTPEHEGLAGLLYAQNVRSVNHRYADSTPDEPVAFSAADIRRAPVLTPVQVIKACHCLAYQSCETDDWERTEAHKQLSWIEHAATSKLPGYDEAEWCIGDAEVAS